MDSLVGRKNTATSWRRLKIWWSNEIAASRIKEAIKQYLGIGPFLCSLHIFPALSRKKCSF